MDSHSEPVLVFELDSVRYGVPVAVVAEIARAVAVHPLTGAPGVVEGLVDVHGEVAAAIDMRAAFHLQRRPLRAQDMIIVTRTRARLLVLRVDQVLGVERVSVAPLPAAAHDSSASGWARLADGLVLIHDVEKLLSASDASAIDVLTENLRA